MQLLSNMSKQNNPNSFNSNFNLMNLAPQFSNQVAPPVKVITI
jgi:hypothetical protein